MIQDKEKFQKDARLFLETLFSESLEKDFGEIEIRTFPYKQPPRRFFFNSIDKAIDCAYELCNFEIDVYFGVNPKKDKGGKKENIHYLTAFHAEIDYGTDGHKKESKYKNYDEAIEKICKFSPQPTLVVISGGGLHCYFVLNEPVKVADVGTEILENINKSISLGLGGDKGTQDISRVLRIPGTYNYKLPNNSREVKILHSSDKKYNFHELAERFNSPEPEKVVEVREKQKDILDTAPTPDGDESLNLKWDKSIAILPVSDKIKSLIFSGNNGSYSSRSEADMAVIKALVRKGITDKQIEEIFKKFQIGAKYREHNVPDNYLQHSIKKAKTLLSGTEDTEDSIQYQDNKTFTAAELLKEEFEPIVWAVDGIIPEGLSLLCGKPKTYKSWMALNIAIATTNGGIVFNHTSVEQGTVLYLALEDSKRRLQDRLNKVLKGIENTSLKNLYLRTNWRRIDDGGIESLTGWLEDHPDTRVVIIDTLALIRPKKSTKNDYQSDYSTISKLKQVADRFHIAMIVVHHLRKQGADDPFDTVSGTTGQTGSADTVLILQKGRVRTNAELIITGRDVEEKEFAMNFDKSCWSWKVEGDAEEFRQNKTGIEIIELLRNNDEPMKAGEIAKIISGSENGPSESYVRGALSNMAKEEILIQPERGLYELKEKDEPKK